jgi:aminopeptidase N
MTFGPSASRLFLALAATITAACSAQQPAQAPTPLPRPFGHGQASHHIMALAPYTFDNTVIHLRFDFSHKTVFGDELAVIRPKSDGLALVPFNSTDINYQSVTVNGKAAAYDLDAAHTLIDVHLPSPASTGQALKIEFHYSTKPRNGLYFVLPDKAYPGITPEIWTQGEPEFNRNWFPTSDEPNEKIPSELVVTVPKGWTVVGNGSLKAHLRTNDEETWNWDSRLPKSTYLIAFVAGPLSVNHTTLGSLDVDSYVQPPYPDVNATCFGGTNDIVDYFQQRIGVRFPWEKEDQMTAQRFIYGGMENASATIQTALALHPQSEEPESSCDQLVAHELAQQWFGDDATMKDWGDVWLHEGFASYFDELWNEHRNGEAEFEYDR